MRSIQEARRMFRSNSIGKLSNDPLINLKYRFVAAATLTCRFAIEGGMLPESAYNMSDLYIQQLDICHSKNKIQNLIEDMYRDFTQAVIDAKSMTSYSKYTLDCMNYIYENLHHKITVAELSEHINLSPSYLSTLFKKETGLSISAYICNKRIEAACNMLIHSEYTYTEISNFLAFSSLSHFIQVFKTKMGYTPKEYRNQHYQFGNGLNL